MISWDHPELKSSLEKRYGLGHQELAFKSLDSIFQNQDFSRYHYSEIDRLISEHMTDKKSVKDYFRLVMSTDANVKESEFIFRTSCKAHIISLLRHLHCAPDLLAHTIYYCLGFNLNDESFLEESKVTLYQVKLILKQKSEYKSLLKLVNCLTNNDDYKYLQDWGNHTKHRANVVPNLTYSLVSTGKDIYNFTFEAFSFKGREYPVESVMSFLNREYDRESEQIILIGMEINKLVEK
ncbi:hypothetical protein [Vibrio gallaecicus]|uniref:Uncharacterized protein n=1 Tax=Vibrio gallaecicus TaxID=552386 RepID=A0ABV4NFR5_9VIBR